MSFVLHQLTKPFVFGIFKKINNSKYTKDTLMLFVILNFHHSIVVDICVLDHMIKQFVYGMLKHPKYYIFLIDINMVNSNKNNNIGGNGYTICSGSYDITICIWNIETTKQLTVFNGHKSNVWSVKYGSNGLGNIGSMNTILSGSHDKSVRLWDIRSGQQIQMFNGHTNKYSPFIANNIEIGDNSN
ncbi:hypothetical protein RFI_02548, partial [Reticulomyxa filosa]